MAQSAEVIFKIKAETKQFSDNMDGTLQKAGRGFAILSGLAAAGVIAVGKSAVKAFAEYEQLVGGVDTLFKNSSKLVQKHAQDAFKTTGMSANKYMETVTGFSASLLQSVSGDTNKAALVSNMAMKDMSDNANKMGSSMESIKLAYQGFAKQNYTMLDNLKLGYGGTKTEMERLLKDATKLTGVKYDINNLSDVFNAVHAIQGELGITGTTAKEAQTTIAGSATMMQAAWENLLVGMAGGGGDVDKLINDLVESVGIFANNIMPVIGKALEGIVKAFGQLIPKLMPIVLALLPQLASAVTKIIGSVIGMIPKMINDAIGTLPGFLQPIAGLLTGITVALGLLAVAFKIVTTAIMLKAAALKIAAAAQAIFNAVMSANPIAIAVIAIAALIALIIAIAMNWDKVVKFFQASAAVIGAFFNGLKIWFEEFITGIGIWLGQVGTFFTNIYNGIKAFVVSIIEAVKGPLTTIIMIVTWPFRVAFALVQAYFIAAFNFWKGIVMWVGNVFKAIVGFISKPFINAFNFIVIKINLFRALVAGFISYVGSKFAQAKNFVMAPFIAGINAIKSKFDWLKRTIGGVIGGIGSFISNMFDGAVKNIKNMINNFIIRPLNFATGLINKIPGVNIPKIPMLAKGGIVNKATLAVIGEAGSEAVVPMENDRVMSSLANKILSKATPGVANNSNSNVSTVSTVIENLFVQAKDYDDVENGLLRLAKGAGW